MKFIEDHYFTLSPLISALMVGAGFLIKLYLNKAGLNDGKRLGIFWIKFVSNALIVIGVFFF
jgi:hypothetical protein